MHCDGDALAQEHRVVWNVVLITQHQLQRVLPWLEVEGGLGLTTVRRRPVRAPRGFFAYLSSVELSQKRQHTQLRRFVEPAKGLC